VIRPRYGVNLRVVYTRTNSARGVVAGFATAMPTLAEFWQHLDQALADVPALGAIIARLTGELDRTRLDRANLLAAMRAALAAHADGEADPLGYLRDELADYAARNAAESMRPRGRA
jgi:hypothetical protein